MKAYLEVVAFEDVIATSNGGNEKVCCDFGCGTDILDLAGNI